MKTLLKNTVLLMAIVAFAVCCKKKSDDSVSPEKEPTTKEDTATYCSVKIDGEEWKFENNGVNEFSAVLSELGQLSLKIIVEEVVDTNALFFKGDNFEFRCSPLSKEEIKVGHIFKNDPNSDADSSFFTPTYSYRDDEGEVTSAHIYTSCKECGGNLEITKVDWEKGLLSVKFDYTATAAFKLMEFKEGVINNITFKNFTK